MIRCNTRASHGARKSEGLFGERAACSQSSMLVQLSASAAHVVHGHSSYVTLLASSLERFCGSELQCLHVAIAPCQQSNETMTLSEHMSEALQATKCCINMLDGRFYDLGWR